MATRQTPKTFNPKDTLKTIRELSLNPVITELNNLKTLVTDTVIPKVDKTYDNVDFNNATSILKFTTTDNLTTKDIDLSQLDSKGLTFEGVPYSLLPDFAGSGKQTNVKYLKFELGDIDLDSDGNARLDYKWDKIIPKFQSYPSVTMPSFTTRSEYNILILKGKGSEKYFEYKPTGVAEKHESELILDLPEIPNVTTAKIGTSSGDYVVIDKVQLLGVVGNSKIDGTTLQIDMPSGGTPGVKTDRYFEGFYQDVDSLKASVTSPFDDRSTAYVNLHIEGGEYYVLHWYHSGEWVPVKTRPTLIYEGGVGETNQGVISFKNVAGVTVDANGQLDLTSLKNPDPELRWFMGIYNTLAEITAIPVDELVGDRSFAYLRNKISGSYQSYSYRYGASGAGSPAWRLTPGQGHLMLVTPSTTANSYTPIYGIKSNSAASVDSKGVLTIQTPIPTPEMKFTVTDYTAGGTVTANIAEVKYMRGLSNVYLDRDTKTATIQHPQQVVPNFTKAWKDTHKSKDYLGNIFYDETSGAWYGMTDDHIPATEEKWTRIAHRDMSEEVKDLSKRVPKKAPITAGGTLGDNAQWEHSGWSYIEAVGKDDTSDLPSDIKTSGAYVQTYVKNVDGETGIPQVRMQTCYEDKDGGSQWVRRTDTNPGSGDPAWKSWVRTSFSTKDIERHAKDPNCHKDVIKFYRVATMTGVYQEIHNQTIDGLTGQMRASNFHTLADNYGHAQILDDSGSVPYDNGFTTGGVIEFSGYTGAAKNSNVPVGKWTILLRIQKNGSTEWKKLREWYYTHTSEKGPYPNLQFDTAPGESVDYNRGDKVSLHLTFDSAAALKRMHPDLYIVPIRSYIYYQDKYTETGQHIAENYRMFFGALDVNGALGVKIHHVTPDVPTSAIRMYGTRIVKDTTEMNYVP